MKNIKSQGGFVLLVAIIACAILAALGVLVFSLSTGDLRTSVSTLGEKKALGAVECGYHIITQHFDPMAIPSYGLSAGVWVEVNSELAGTNDPGSRYKITNIALSSFAPIPPPGSSMEQGQGWGMARYDLTVVGQNSIYNTDAQVDVGIAYGPISLSLIYR